MQKPQQKEISNGCSGPPLPLFSSGLSEAKKELRIDGQSLGYGTAFSAVALSQRPVCDAHQSKLFGSGIPIVSPRARIPGRLTSSRLVSSARTVGFYQLDLHCRAVWHACYIPPGKLPVCFDDL